MSVACYRGSPRKFGSRTLNRKTLDRRTGRMGGREGEGRAGSARSVGWEFIIIVCIISLVMCTYILNVTIAMYML